MTYEEKQKAFAPKPYMLFCNGKFVEVIESHKKAKAIKYWKNREANENMLDESYYIAPYKHNELL